MVSLFIWMRVVVLLCTLYQGWVFLRSSFILAQKRAGSNSNLYTVGASNVNTCLVHLIVTLNRALY